jgi:hypothetical protein
VIGADGDAHFSFPHQRKSALDNMFHGEAQSFHHHISWGRGAESLDPDDVAAVAYITMPPLRQSRFNSKSRPHGPGQD